MRERAKTVTSKNLVNFPIVLRNGDDPDARRFKPVVQVAEKQ